MKPSHQPIKVVTSLLAVCGLAICSSFGQTVITPDLKAPPSAYSSEQGFVIKTYRTQATRGPGDQNSIENVEKQLAGEFGPNTVPPGPLTGGLYSNPWVNFNLEPFSFVDTQWVPFSQVPIVFPGIDEQSTATNNFSMELITYIELPAGETTLVIGSGDSFRVTIGVGDNPFDFTAIQPNNGIYGSGRAYDTNDMVLNVVEAGVYPMRIVFGQGGGGAGLQVFSLANWNTPEDPLIQPALVNDPFALGFPGELKSYMPSSLPITPSKAYVNLLSPLPGAADAYPIPTIKAQITDGGTTVDTNTIILKLDDTTVDATITQAAGITTVEYTESTILDANSTHTASLTFTDSASNETSQSWDFSIRNFITIPASYAYPVGSGDASQPGIAGRIHQHRANFDSQASVSVANAQIAGTLIDPGTGLPFVNLVVTNGNPIIDAGWTGTRPVDAGGAPGDSRTFVESDYVNYSINGGAVASEGNFDESNGYPDELWPGTPGANADDFVTYDNSEGIACELVAWLELSEGLQEIGVRSSDGFELAVSPNNAADIFRQRLASREVGAGDGGNVAATLFVETAGVYAFRVVYRSYLGNGRNHIEWYWNDPSVPGSLTLVNDDAAGGVKAYRAVTVPTRAYVKSVSPEPNASGVSTVPTIEVVMADLGETAPTLTVAGKPAPLTPVTTNGTDVTFTYTPDSPLPGGTSIDCELTYDAAVSSWTFVTQSGRKALMITRTPANTADGLLVTHLAANYALDVEVVDQSYVNANPTDVSIAEDKALVLISSQVASGQVDDWCWSFVNSNLPVPLITWEYALTDDLAMRDGSGGQGNIGGNAQTEVVITNETHYLAAGLPSGVNVVYTKGNNMGHATPAPPGGITIAFESGPQGRTVISAVETGLAVNDPPNGNLPNPTIHAARKVWMGMLSNATAPDLTEAGWALFDAAIEWMLPPAMTAEAGPGAGEMTLSWTSEGTLQVTDSLNPPNWQPAANQDNPQVIQTSGKNQQFYRVAQ